MRILLLVGCLLIGYNAIGQEWYEKPLQANALETDTSYLPGNLNKNLVFFNRLLETEPKLVDAIYYKALIHFRLYKNKLQNPNKQDDLKEAERNIRICILNDKNNQEYKALLALVSLALLNEGITKPTKQNNHKINSLLETCSNNPRMIIASVQYRIYCQNSDTSLLTQLNKAKAIIDQHGQTHLYPTWGAKEIADLKSILKRNQSGEK
jgi:hypothetical protein